MSKIGSNSYQTKRYFAQKNLKKKRYKYKLDFFTHLRNWTSNFNICICVYIYIYILRSINWL